MYPCPYCDPGSIHLLKGAVVTQDTPESLRDRDHEEWEPEWIRETAFLQLQCTNPICKGYVFGLANAQVEHYYDYHSDEEIYESILTPVYFHPALPMMKVPEQCPSDVADQIGAATAMYWSDPSAAGNRLRNAVEELLTEQRVARSSLYGKKKRRLKHMRRLFLTERIERFKEKRADLVEHLNAIRWIGNEGTHSDVLSHEDILDAMEILESVLDQLYARTAHRITTMITEINQRKKSRSRKSKKG